MHIAEQFADSVVPAVAVIDHIPALWETTHAELEDDSWWAVKKQALWAPMLTVLLPLAFTDENGPVTTPLKGVGVDSMVLTLVLRSSTFPIIFPISVEVIRAPSLYSDGFIVFHAAYAMEDRITVTENTIPE